MVDSKHVDPLRALIALDRRVCEARAILQRTSEIHPDFERRVAALVELVSARDQVLAGHRACRLVPPGKQPPAA